MNKSVRLKTDESATSILDVPLAFVPDTACMLLLHFLDRLYENHIGC